MIRIGVCDDCPTFLSQAKFMIDHWDDAPQNILTELFDNGDALISAHLKNPFDIILLDIVMPMLNGIETAREIRQEDKDVKIVFLTSSSEFAVESYTVKANDYLLKPVEPAKLFACLNEQISMVKSSSKHLTVKGLDAIHRLSASDIEYIESQSKHIVFHTAKGRTVESVDPLYFYEDTLRIEDGFYKCHRSYIVNVHHISSFTHTEVIMHSGKRIPISRSNQKSFEDVYFRVIFEKAGDRS